MPKVSVIVPVYNTEEYLPQCIESILGQTFPDLEIIIVDDGSTDNSLEIAKKYAESENRIHIISQKNSGPSEARNAGLEIAQGEWITFVDSDDVLDTSFLHKLIEAISSTDAEIACCRKKNFSAFSNQKIPSNTKTPSKKTLVIAPLNATVNALYQNDRPDYSAWNKLYAAKFWKTRRFPAGKYFEDMATIPQVFLETNKVAFIDEPLYFYRKRATSILATPYDKKKAELLDIAESVCSLVSDRGSLLEKAARSNLFSASCSILKRTDETDEFEDFRNRAWIHIQDLRVKTLLDRHARIRNKIAALISFTGKRTLTWALRRLV